MSSPLTDTLQDFQLARQFVELAATTILEAAHDIPSQCKDGGVAAVGSEHGGAGIQNAGPGNHCEHAGAATGARIAESHIRTGLLVAGTESTDAVAVACQRIGEAVDLRAGKSEHRIDTMHFEAFYQGVSASELLNSSVIGFHIITCYKLLEAKLCRLHRLKLSVARVHNRKPQRNQPNRNAHSRNKRHDCQQTENERDTQIIGQRVER
ncbi:hypothetical protein D9M69_537400 [compost metagenome]